MSFARITLANMLSSFYCWAENVQAGRSHDGDGVGDRISWQNIVTVSTVLRFELTMADRILNDYIDEDRRMRITISATKAFL